jgi:mono/diheme cytochrome c family protein
MIRKILNRKNYSKAVLITLLLFFGVVIMSFTIKVDGAGSAVQGKWVAPVSAKKLKNPNSGKASIKNGQKVYKLRCAVCHGATGKGDSPAGKALKPPAADHTSKAVQVQTDGELFWKISEGRGPMVGWKLILQEKERWDLVNFIRSLAQE